MVVDIVGVGSFTQLSIMIYFYGRRKLQVVQTAEFS